MRKIRAALSLCSNMGIRLRKFRYFRIAGFALGAVVVAGVAVALTASASGFGFGKPAASTSLTKSSVSSTACTDFMSHFAVDIGKSQAQINAAFQKAIGETLADQVKNKQLTQAQADAIKAKLANQTPCTLPATVPHSGPKATIASYMDAYENAAATALGITPAQLKADLKAGQSLSQIAAAQKVSEADFRSKLIAALKPALDQAVTSGKLTSAQEQTIVSRLQSGPLPLWNPPARHKPATTPTPSAA